MLNPALHISQGAIEAFCSQWNVRELAIFGSAIREDFRTDSDIDVLVSLAPEIRMGLWEFEEIREALESIFQRKVDLVAKEALRNPFRRDAILNTREVLYAA